MPHSNFTQQQAAGYNQKIKGVKTQGEPWTQYSQSKPRGIKP